MHRRPRLLIAIAGLVVFTACAAHHVRIADLQNRPGKYDDRDVSVTGVVTSSFGLPLVPFQLYKIDDGTGEISVVSREGRAPRKGARVRVTGRLNDVATIGGNAIGLHIEERDRKYKD